MERQIAEARAAFDPRLSRQIDDWVGTAPPGWLVFSTMLIRVLIMRMQLVFGDHSDSVAKLTYYNFRTG